MEDSYCNILLQLKQQHSEVFLPLFVVVILVTTFREVRIEKGTWLAIHNRNHLINLDSKYSSVSQVIELFFFWDGGGVKTYFKEIIVLYFVIKGPILYLVFSS